MLNLFTKQSESGRKNYYQIDYLFRFEKSITHFFNRLLTITDEWNDESYDPEYEGYNFYPASFERDIRFGNIRLRITFYDQSKGTAEKWDVDLLINKLQFHIRCLSLDCITFSPKSLIKTLSIGKSHNDSINNRFSTSLLTFGYEFHNEKTWFSYVNHALWVRQAYHS